MYLYLSNNKIIKEIQQGFNSKFPYLKIELYKDGDDERSSPAKKRLPHTMSLRAAGLKKEGLLELRGDITVADLEKEFFEQFGLNAQVSRKSGATWIETTMTDKWSLEKQNDHGFEISHAEPPAKESSEVDD